MCRFDAESSMRNERAMRRSDAVIIGHIWLDVQHWRPVSDEEMAQKCGKIKCGRTSAKHECPFDITTRTSQLTPNPNQRDTPSPSSSVFSYNFRSPYFLTEAPFQRLSQIPPPRACTSLRPTGSSYEDSALPGPQFFLLGLEELPFCSHYL
mmetsp:Transcript_183/g.396  ORF Transcript_183/g.396 Transcript_183/m.396 type:complete len:151 (-) Transcript_183:412-864(-)